MTWSRSIESLFMSCCSVKDTAQDAQYSPGARETLAVLMKYQDVKLSVLMKDSSD